MTEPFEAAIGPLLMRRNLKLVLAESCTGGLVSHHITNVPGSSEYFAGGIVAYTLEAKERLLGVRHDTLQRCGAVSRETVLEMARGVRRTFAPDFSFDSLVGLSISGIAGPGGGGPGTPVGLVWIGLSAPGGEWAWQYHWQGNRTENKDLAAGQALALLHAYLTGQIA